MSNTDLDKDCCGDRVACNTTHRCACGCNLCYCRSCYASHCTAVLEKLLQKPRPQRRPAWIYGPPSLEAVRTHEREYTHTEGQVQSGLWLVIDPQAAVCAHPQFIQLRVGKPGEKIYPPERYHGDDPQGEDAEGKILLQIGSSNWSDFEKAKRALRSKFLPVDQEGVPVCWEGEVVAT